MGCVSFLLAGMASARRLDGSAGRPQDMDRYRPQPDDRAVAVDHDAADVRPVRGVHLHGSAAGEADGVGPDAIGLVFACYGVFGFIGIAIATRIVDSWGAWKTSVLFTALMLTGVTGWALSAGVYPLMAVSVAIWGLGFASTNSMQQVRLVGAAPSLASASVSLNTSVLYVGQAVGSAIGGFLYAQRSSLRRRLCRGGLYRAGAGDGDPDETEEGQHRGMTFGECRLIGSAPRARWQFGSAPALPPSSPALP